MKRIGRILALALLLAGYWLTLRYAPISAQVPRPVDLSATERELAKTIGRVSFNEALDSEPDLELVTQTTLSSALTAEGQLAWLRSHSPCVTGRLTQDEAQLRPGNCRWTRNLHPDGRRPRGWLRELDGRWSRTRVRWREHLTRSVEYVRGERVASICDERPMSWDGVRYGRDRVAPEGSARRILDCREPYTADPGQHGLHNFAVTWAPGGDS